MAHMPHIVVVWCVLLPHSVAVSVCECDCVSCKELPDEDDLFRKHVGYFLEVRLAPCVMGRLVTPSDLDIVAS